MWVCAENNYPGPRQRRWLLVSVCPTLLFTSVFLPIPQAWCRCEKKQSAVDWLFHCLFNWPVNLDRVAYLCECVCMCNKILITIKHQLIMMQGSHIYMKLPVFSLVLTKNLLEKCWLDFFKGRNTAKTVFSPNNNEDTMKNKFKIKTYKFKICLHFHVFNLKTIACFVFWKQHLIWVQCVLRIIMRKVT